MRSAILTVWMLALMLREIPGLAWGWLRESVSDKDVVAKTPVLATLLLEWANVGQLYRMWTEQTAAGQSLVAWISVWFALLIFVNYYRVNRLTTPFWTTVVGVGMNTLVCLTVIYFRYFAS